MKKVIDMTVGSPFKNIFKFAIPIGLGFALQHLYTLGDALIVSLSLGSNAATGVNLTGTIVFFILGFAQGITAGFGIVLSQFVGAKDNQKMKQSVATSIILSLIISAVLSVVSVIIARPLLKLLKTNDLFLDYSASYLQTIFAGLLFTVLYNYNDQIMRAMGDSTTPFIILIVCAVLNIGLNSLLFIFPELTVAWAGWATVISQAISAGIGYVVIYKKFPEIRFNKSDFKLEARFCGRHLSMGLPMALQFMITASGCMVQQRAFNVLPNPLCAMAQGTANKIDNIFGSFLNGAGTAMATFVGQNYGAKNYDRIKKGYFASLGVGAIFTVFSMSLMMTLAVPMAKLLLPASSIPGNPETVYDYVFIYATLQASFYYFLFSIFQLRQCVQGIGRSGVAMCGGIVEFVARFVVAFTLARNSFIGACLSNPLAWVVGAIYLLIAFYICFKKMVKTEQQNNKMVSFDDTVTR